jgi:hypothetical protein
MFRFLPHFFQIWRLSLAWWLIPIIPTTQEAEAGGAPAPGQLGKVSETLSQKQNKNRRAEGMAQSQMLA